MLAEKLDLTYDDALLVVAEVQRRAEARSLCLVDDNFPKQAAFLRDPSRLKAALCTRRAGKSEGGSRWLTEPCIQFDGVNTLYVGLTKDTCRKIFWEGAIKPLIAKFKIPCKLNETRLEVKFPNGSFIYCLGMDVDKEEMKKLLGGKYKRILIDEAGSFRVNLFKLVYEILKPSTADLLGEIALTGTPEDLTSGLFYEVTRQDGVPRRLDWSVHEWNTFDNPYMAQQWEIEIDEMIAVNPRVVETPMFKRMYLGKWEIDETRLVYKYNRERNWIAKLPEGDYTNGLGIDLGFNDDSSFVVSSYNGESPKLYLRHPFKKPGMIISDVGDKTNYYRGKYDILSYVIDGANKQAVEELRKRFAIPFISADKAGKAEFIDIFNSELIQGNIVLVGDDCDIIEKEWNNLIWDDRSTTKREEHPACANHLSDAILYIWRNQYQYLYQKPVKAVKKTEEQKIDEWLEEESSRIADVSNSPFWERDY